MRNKTATRVKERGLPDSTAVLSENLRSLLWIIIVATCLLRLGVAGVRFLQVDELQILHLAWLRADGSIPGSEHAFPQFSLLIDLLEPLWRVLGENLNGIWVARFFMWTVSLAILAAVWLIVDYLFGEEEALCAVGMLSVFTDFHERAIEVRSDPFIVLCLLVAFYLLARNRNLSELVGAGALSALALAFNFKALAALPFLGLAGAFPSGVHRDSARTKWWGRLLLFGAGLTVGLLAYLAYLLIRGDLTLFVETLGRNLRVATGPGTGFSPGIYLLQSLGRNLFFYAFLLYGLVVLLRTRRSSLEKMHWFLPLAFTACFIYVNPTFYPYNFVDVAPFWALPAGLALLIALQKLHRRPAKLVLTAMLVIVGIRLGVLLKPTIDDQVAINEFAMSVTGSEERVYDASGLILFRRGPFRWRLHSLMVERYRRGTFRLSDQLRDQPPRLFVPSYRTEWLNPSDSSAIERLFVQRHPSIRTLGWVFDSDTLNSERTTTFEVLLSGHYRIENDAHSESSLLINGAPAHETRWLAQGEHTLSIHGSGTISGRTALIWDRDGLEDALESLPDREMKFFYSFTY